MYSTLLSIVTILYNNMPDFPFLPPFLPSLPLSLPLSLSPSLPLSLPLSLPPFLPLSLPPFLSPLLPFPPFWRSRGESLAVMQSIITKESIFLQWHASLVLANQEATAGESLQSRSLSLCNIVFVSKTTVIILSYSFTHLPNILFFLLTHFHHSLWDYFPFV
jgi:hypothetical protein